MVKCHRQGKYGKYYTMLTTTKLLGKPPVAARWKVGRHTNLSLTPWWIRAFVTQKERIDGYTAPQAAEEEG